MPIAVSQMNSEQPFPSIRSFDDVSVADDHRHSIGSELGIRTAFPIDRPLTSGVIPDQIPHEAVVADRLADRLAFP